MTTREQFDRWGRAQEVAARLIREDLGHREIHGPGTSLTREAGVRADWPSAAELAGLELCPFRLEVRRFNRLRLEFLQRLLADGWTEALLVEICHARPEGIRALARQLFGGG